MRAKRGRVRHIQLAGFFIARVWIFNRTSGFQVVPGRPCNAVNERVGGQQFAIQPVDREEKSVFGCVVENFAFFAAPRFGGQDDRLRRGIVPAFGRCFLIMPDIFAGIGFQRDDGGQEQIVAFAI